MPLQFLTKYQPSVQPRTIDRNSRSKVRQCALEPSSLATSACFSLLICSRRRNTLSFSTENRADSRALC